MRFEILKRFLEDTGIVPDRETLDRFAGFWEDLYAQNGKMNLTRVAPEECEIRHFVDSLLIHPLCPRDARILDIGAGPGFPSWPLACARPDLRVTACDSSGKMLGFLARHPLRNLTLAHFRAETWGMRERFDVVTGRALAPLSAQLELSAAPCRVGGFVIPFRTPAEENEIQEIDVGHLGLRLEEIVRSELPGTDVARVFPKFLKVAATPREYPRAWARMKSHPKARF